MFTLVTLGTGIAAINTGNNMLFLMLGLMLGLIIASGVLSERALNALDIRRQLPRRARAGTRFSVSFAVTNRQRALPALAVEVRDIIDGAPFRRSGFFLKIDPGQTRHIDYPCDIAARGTARFSGVRIATRFPFGLFEKRHTLSLDESLLVWPAPQPPPRWPKGAHATTAANAAATDAHSPTGDDFFQLRDYQPGDDPRYIHWPSSARQQKPVVRDLSQDPGAPVEIVLDAARHSEEPRTDTGDARTDTGDARIDPEDAIRVAAALIEDIVAQGHPVRLITAGPEAPYIAESRTAPPLLDHLARLDTATLATCAPPQATRPGACLIGPGARSDMRATRIPVPPPQAKPAKPAPAEAP
ncbi:MAG: DUF58 domain-containing protein [Myxococcales bacterium]|nr:DUF58 domain-containing protein [Myxococcales bacterium]